MKVALVSDWFAPRRGGIEGHLRGLGGALITVGAGVTVITGQPGAVSDVAGLQALTLPGRRIPRLDIAASPWLAAHAQAALADAAPDVVHVHASIIAPSCLAGAIAARRLDLPLVVTFHSDMRHARRPLALIEALLRLTRGRVILSGVSGIVAEQVAWLNPARAPIVLPNGFDAGFWSAGAAERAPQAERFRIVSALRLERKKRPGALLALRDTVAARTGRHVELVLAGDGAMRPAVERRAEVIGWQSREGLRELYRSADLFVAPSRRESFGIAALEARAAGLPVIGRAGTGLSDFITEGKDGFLGQSDAAMAHAAVRLAGDPALRARLSGPRTGVQRFDWPEVAAAHLALYREAISGSGG